MPEIWLYIVQREKGGNELRVVRVACMLSFMHGTIIISFRAKKAAVSSIRVDESSKLQCASVRTSTWYILHTKSFADEAF